MSTRKSHRMRRVDLEDGTRARVFEKAPAHVLAERERCMAYEPTPNILILGDPVPGRSALDQRGRGAFERSPA